MKPSSFDEMNTELTPPEGMLDCGVLPCHRNGREVISLWRPSIRERISVFLFGRVWLRIVSPLTHPPVSIQGIRRIFEKV